MVKIKRDRKQFYKGKLLIGKRKYNKFLNIVLESGKYKIIVDKKKYILIPISFLLLYAYFGYYAFAVLFIIIVLEYYVSKNYGCGVLTAGNYKTRIKKGINERFFYINDVRYEIYSHGGNYYSLMKNDLQIGLISTDVSEWYRERNYNCDIISCEIDLELLNLVVMYIDAIYYNRVMSVGMNKFYFGSIYNATIILNLKDKYRSRLLFKGEEESN